MRVLYVLLTLLGIAVAVSWAQGINPVTPASNSMIEIRQPAFIDPSSLYTTPTLLGSVTPEVVGTTPITGGATTQVLFNNAGVLGSDAGLTKVAGATGAVAVGGALSVSGQLRTTFGTPTIASGACGTTTNGVVTSGTNQAGLITIGAAATTTCTVSFSTTITAPNACVIFPASTGAAATGTTVAYVSSITTAQFVITGSALASTAYYYFCM